MGWQLDLMILEVFSNIKDSVIFTFFFILLTIPLGKQREEWASGCMVLAAGLNHDNLFVLTDHLLWRSLLLVPVFQCVGSHLCSLLCSADVRVLWPGFLLSPFLKWLKIIPGKSACEGLSIFCDTEKMDKTSCCTCVGWACPASPYQLSFPAALCQDMGQAWYARSSWAERRMLQDEAPLPLLFSWEMLKLSPGFFSLDSSAEALFPWGITGVKDRLNEWNLMA